MAVDSPQPCFTHITCDNAECTNERQFRGCFRTEKELRDCVTANWGWTTYQGTLDLCPDCTKHWEPEEEEES